MGKILFVANVTKEHINKFHIPTIQALKDKGWTVDVASSGEESVTVCDTHYQTSWKRSPFSLATFKGVNELKQIILENDYDLIYCHTPVGGLVTRLPAMFIGKRKRKVKIVYCAHGFHFYKGAPWINWAVYYPIEKFLAKFTQTIITINPEDFESAKRKFSKQTAVKLIPGVGIDFSRLNVADKKTVRSTYRKELDIPDDGTVMIYVAELIKNKNQAMLLKMLKKLEETSSDNYLVLVGPDHYDGKISGMVEQLNITEKVRLTGWRNDVGELFAMSDICVASSIREGFGINLVEAMYAGLPVVATENRGHVSVIEDGESGLLVAVDDYQAAAKKIEELKTNQVLRKKLSQVDVTKYESQAVAKEITQLLIAEVS